MDKKDRGAYWMGESIDHMTRERLLDVVYEMTANAKAERENHGRTLDTWRMAQKARARG